MTKPVINVYNSDHKVDKVPRTHTTAEIRQFIREEVQAHPSSIALVTAERFEISRQAAHRHVRALVEDGYLVAEGKTRARSYRTATVTAEHQYGITPNLEEHRVWDEAVAPVLNGLPENVVSICHYGITEMVNNAIDHSESSALGVEVIRALDLITLTVFDSGIGIFKKIQQAAHLESERAAILQLQKGKFTTDPERHTGEGIFFTSRMFDQFGLLSGRLWLGHVRASRDWLLEQRDDAATGTYVTLQIAPQSTVTAKDVFDYYATERDDFAFNKTIVALRLAGPDPLISRSQARRVVAQLDQFHEVILDFAGVDTVGPAFADEVFRVFWNQHPDMTLIPLRANEDVQRIVVRAIRGRGTGNIPDRQD